MQLKNKTYANSRWAVSAPIAILLFSLSFMFSCHQGNTDTASANKKNATSIIELPKPTPIAKAEADRLHTACEQWFDSALLYRGFNGGMLVAKNGNIVFEKYTGTGHLPGTDLITAETPLQIASTSKTFTAMAVLKLWQDGKLNIDDELSKYIKNFNYPGVTIRSLLTHRSGLPNYLYFMDNLGWDKTKNATNADVLNYLVTKKAQLEDISTPNTHFTYCNTNYALLALLVELVTSKKFPQYLQETFFAPLQMKHSFVFNPLDSIKVDLSYDRSGRLNPLNSLDGVYGDKNVYTTPQDLLIWDRALRSDKIFKPETLTQAYAPYSNEKPGVRNYGLGWRMNIYPDGKKMIYHNGWWHGNRAVFIRLLKEDATIIIISNKDNSTIYKAKILCNLFGDYYGGDEEDDNESSRSTDVLSPLQPNKPIINEVKISKKNEKLQQLFKDKNKITTHH